MAIDDNTTYGLTGAQVKDLAQRVKDAGEGLITLSYGISTWQDFIDAYSTNNIVYCRASSNSDPATGTQTRMAFMAYINNPTAPTEVEFQYVRSVATKSASNQSDQVFVYKLASANGGTWTVETRPVMVKVSAGTNMTSSYSNNTLTLNATDTTYSDFTGTDGQTAGAAGLVPAPAATDVDKFLKSDGTWDTAGGGSQPVYTLTSADFNWNSTTNTAAEPYNCVALWLLPPGVYNVGSLTVNSQWKVNNSMGGNESSYNMFVVTAPSFQNYVFIYGYFNGNVSSTLPISLWRVLKTTGGIFTGDPVLYLTTGSVVQTTGTSATDVMSQNATTKMVFQDPSTRKHVVIGNSTSVSQPADGLVVIGNGAAGRGDTVSIGRSAGVNSPGLTDCVNIGEGARCNSNMSVALGSSATTSRVGEVNIGTGNSSVGYNNTTYRVLGGVHDGQDAHDAATVGQVNTRLGGLTLLPITQAAYDALATKDANTLYVITGA